jgi:hypothetical protein
MKDKKVLFQGTVYTVPGLLVNNHPESRFIHVINLIRDTLGDRKIRTLASRELGAEQILRLLERCNAKGITGAIPKGEKK